MKAVIMAGGKGTRISSIVSDKPKPLIPIGDKPILEHEILCLKKQGFTDILITVSYLGEQIIDYLDDAYNYNPQINGALYDWITRGDTKALSVINGSR